MRYGKRGQAIPDSTAANPVPGRTAHWIKGNAQERIPHRWIVADTESRRELLPDGEQLRFRLACATRWRDDLATGEHVSQLRTNSAADFWRWVTEWCWTHGRTVLWFHNAGHDLGQSNAFEHLPNLGYELVWCNLDRDVSVATWRGPNGTLAIADTYTWCPTSLENLGALVGHSKPPLPDDDDTDEAWYTRCEADVEITRRVVERLLAYIRKEHLGNWQPSGAGMGHTAWRHRFMNHKVLVHDDADAITAERTAMHAGRAEAWHHGKAGGGPFTEWDMAMSYPHIAAECLLPAKLWDHDVHPSQRVHQWSLETWRTLAEVTVTTEQPTVPARLDGRIYWPVGTFDTTLWDAELQLLTDYGGSYQVHQQWRYSRKPVLADWARWSIGQVGLSDAMIDPVARTWAKHQARATIGRLGLRTPTWEEWGPNWLNHTGISLLTDTDTGQTHRMMHVGSKVLQETGRAEASNAVPAIPSWIMAEARSRLWRAADAAGLENVLHLDTDSLIANAEGTMRLTAAIAAGLPGHWRPKATWRTLEITGPRHYTAPDRRQIPGVPKRARLGADGKYHGEVWDSLARSLTEGPGDAGRIRQRTWTPRRADHRRPYTTDQPGPAQPVRLPKPPTEGNNHDSANT